MDIKVKITVYPEMGDAFSMVFYVPPDRDAEEYVEEMLGKIINERFSYSDWEFV